MVGYSTAAVCVNDSLRDTYFYGYLVLYWMQNSDSTETLMNCKMQELQEVWGKQAILMNSSEYLITLEFSGTFYKTFQQSNKLTVFLFWLIQGFLLSHTRPLLFSLFGCFNSELFKCIKTEYCWFSDLHCVFILWDYFKVYILNRKRFHNFDSTSNIDWNELSCCLFFDGLPWNKQDDMWILWQIRLSDNDLFCITVLLSTE